MTLIKYLKLGLGFLLVSTFLGIICLDAADVSGPAVSGGKDNQCLVYVGTYSNTKSKGIYACRMDLATGALTPLGLEAETPNPTFLAIDSRHQRLYAVNEIGRYEGKPAGSIEAFSIDAGSGKLTSMGRHTSIGSGPCHLALDQFDRNVLVANYGSGSIAAFPIQPDGRLGDKTAFIQDAGQSINPHRQEGPHAHCMVLDAANRFAFACDLGLDKIMIYRFDPINGTLSPNEPAFAKVTAGSGPRHLAFSPGERRAYLINELKSTITTFAYDRRRGSLKEMQTVSTLPDDFNGENTAAEVEVHSTGKFLFGSNRGHDSIAVFAIDRTKGTLTHIQDVPTQGKTPRHFAIDPTGRYLVAANQDSGNLVVFAIDGKSGRLTATGQTLDVPTPACVAFMRQPGS